jgi:hypothetical protein
VKRAIGGDADVVGRVLVDAAAAFTDVLSDVPPVPAEVDGTARRCRLVSCAVNGGDRQNVSADVR